VYLAHPRTSAKHQVRIHFADAGCPVMFDSYYHPSHNLEVRRKAFAGEGRPEQRKPEELPLKGALGLQLFRLELPDPLRPRRMLRIELPELPEEWMPIHPPDRAEEHVDKEAWEAAMG